MEETVTPASIRDLLLFLAAAGVIVPLLNRLRVSSVLGFLAAGVLLGPFGLGRLAADLPVAGFLTISDPEEIEVLAELGVVFLLFAIGLELSLERLKRLRRFIVGLGGLQVLLTGAAIAGVGLAAGLDAEAAAIVGLALALSSTAIILPVLAEREGQQTPSGRLSFAVLLAQDLALIPILFGIGVLGSRGSETFVSELLGRFIPVGVVFGVLIASGPLVLRPMLKAAARARTRELFVAACLLAVLVTGLIAQTAGVSMALGAFIAGLVLAETEYQREIEVTVDPFKGLLLGAFFISVGIRLDIGLLAREPVLILSAATALVVGKAVIVFGLARLFRAPTPAAVQTALVLGAGGEFAFVILGAAAAADLVSPELEGLVLVTATVTMFLIPGLAALGGRFGRAAEARAAIEDTPNALEQHEVSADVIVVGYGRVGQLVVEMLGRHGKSFLVVDADPSVVSRGRRHGLPILFGDATRRDLLQRISLAEAQALVVTLPGVEAADAVVTAARQLRPDLTIVARARNDEHAARLYEIGATDAVPETVEASLQLAENTLVDIGVPMGLVIASIHQRREEFRDLFRAKIEGDREPRAVRAANG